MRFTGVILSDSMNMAAIRKNYSLDESAVLAVLAGVDMMLLAEEHYDHNASVYLEKQLVMLHGILDAVRKGRIPIEYIDEAAGRIIELKERSGLFKQLSLSSDALYIIGSSAHRKLEAKVAEAAVTLVRDTSNLLPLPKEGPIVLINAAPHSAYEILTKTRGIGPNQSKPAFDVFKEELLSQGFEFTSFSSEEIQRLQSMPIIITEAKIIIGVTEDYTLPGADFDTESQKKLVKRLEKVIGERMLVIGLRSPYELAEYPNVSTCICTCSSRPCAAAAAVKIITGQIPVKGQLPVSIP